MKKSGILFLLIALCFQAEGQIGTYLKVFAGKRISYLGTASDDSFLYTVCYKDSFQSVWPDTVFEDTLRRQALVCKFDLKGTLKTSTIISNVYLPAPLSPCHDLVLLNGHLHFWAIKLKSQKDSIYQKGKVFPVPSDSYTVVVLRLNADDLLIENIQHAPVSEVWPYFKLINDDERCFLLALGKYRFSKNSYFQDEPLPPKHMKLFDVSKKHMRKVVAIDTFETGTFLSYFFKNMVMGHFGASYQSNLAEYSDKLVSYYFDTFGLQITDTSHIQSMLFSSMNTNSNQEMGFYALEAHPSNFRIDSHQIPFEDTARLAEYKIVIKEKDGSIFQLNVPASGKNKGWGCVEAFENEWAFVLSFGNDFPLLDTSLQNPDPESQRFEDIHNCYAFLLINEDRSLKHLSRVSLSKHFHPEKIIRLNPHQYGLYGCFKAPPADKAIPNYGMMTTFLYVIDIERYQDSTLGIERLSTTPQSIFIPNAFTPNDPHNPYWYPVSAQQEIMSVKIMDLTGRLLYDYEGTKPRWDGTCQGQELPMNTYLYQILVRDQSYVGIMYLLK